MALHEYMKRVVEQREVLSRSQARALLDLVLVGSTEAGEPGSPHSLQLAALLGAIAARGETASELAGFAEAMLAAAIPVPLDDAERSLLLLKGAVPGPRGGLVLIRDAVKGAK